MLTLCIHYVLDPNRMAHFRTYLHEELAVIRRCGGKIVGYFLPTDFAGPTNEAYGLISFSSLASYEQYRHVLAEDPLHRKNAAALERSGVIVAVKRSLIEQVRDDPSS